MLVQVLTAVLEDLLVDEFNLTGRRQAGDHAGNGLHDQARLALAFAQRQLRPLALGQVDHERHALVGRSAEHRAPGQDRHARAVLPQEFPFLHFVHSAPPQFLQRA